VQDSLDALKLIDNLEATVSEFFQPCAVLCNAKLVHDYGQLKSLIRSTRLTEFCKQKLGLRRSLPVSVVHLCTSFLKAARNPVKGKRHIAQARCEEAQAISVVLVGGCAARSV